MNEFIELSGTFFYIYLTKTMDSKNRQKYYSKITLKRTLR